MKTPQYTPWQLWAQSYVSSAPGFEGDLIDNEDADKYAHAAWEECKRRVIRILESYERGYTSSDAPALQIHSDLEYIDLDALEEVRKL